MAKDFWSKKRSAEGNTAISNTKRKSEDEWDAEASVTIEEEDLSLSVIMPGWMNYENN